MSSPHRDSESDHHLSDRPDKSPGDLQAAPTRGLPSVHDTGTGTGSASTATDMGRLARDLQQQVGSAATMEHVVDWALQLIPGAEHVSVSRVHRRRTVTSAAATSEVSRRFDNLQQEVGQGPSLDSMYTQQTLRVKDFATETRWPALAARWAEVGARSALCLQLFVHGGDLGAINVLSERADAFTDESEHWGLLVASHASTAMAASLKIEGLDRANVNRTVIGQAEGILMERFKLNPDVAFALLARVSQDTNRKLHLVAADLVRTGEVAAPAEGRERYSVR